MGSDHIEEDCLFGPDARRLSAAEHNAEPVGVFGLSHEALVESEWIRDGALTVRLELELKADVGDFDEDHLDTTIEASTAGTIPPPALVSELSRMLEDEVGSDVSFLVNGIRIQAHSLLLRARSAVFDSLLTSGLRESTAREIVIEDCDAVSFKAFLKFLYTDDFECIPVKRGPPQVAEAREGEASASAS